MTVVASNGTRVGNWTTSNATFTTALPKGSYRYTATAPTGWSKAGPEKAGFKVRGAAVAVPVPFRIAAGFVAVVLEETGLAPGTVWTVSLNWSGSWATGFPETTPPDLNATESSNRTSIAFSVVKGALYLYSVALVGGYGGPSAETGYLAVTHGSRTSFSTTFFGPLYTLGFSGVGVGATSNWTVVVHGTVLPAEGPGTVSTSLFAYLTYHYRVVPPRGYRASPRSGKVLLDQPETVVIVFASD
ncbi:MAG TPA: hypothetical protein VEE86_02150 [Thermoplasmata archaeon]|nr:hypothetical protein [Thermoplasmata archaeon]